MKKKLYILDSIEAIKILLRYENPKNIEIITLNFSLNNFLKLKKIFSRNIYEYFSNSEIKKCVNKSYSTLNRTLVSLDEDLRRNNFFKKKKITSFFHPIFITQYQKTFFSYFLLKKLLEKKINLKKYKVTIFYDNFLLKNKFPIYESLGSNKLFKDIELRIVNSKNSDLLFQIKTQILNLNHILRFITSRLKTFYLKKLLKIKNIFLKNKFKILLLNYDYNL